MKRTKLADPNRPTAHELLEVVESSMRVRGIATVSELMDVHGESRHRIRHALLSLRDAGLVTLKDGIYHMAPDVTTTVNPGTGGAATDPSVDP